MDIEHATMEDIAAELKRRDMSFALVFWQLHRIRPGGDIPEEDGCTYFGSDSNPLFNAGLLCDGVQMAISDCLMQGIAEGECLALSDQTRELKNAIGKAIED